MKAVFCRETLWDDPHPLSTNYLARSLVRRGWEVLWLTGPWHPYAFLRPRWLDRKMAKLKMWIRGGGPPSSNGVSCYAFATLLPYRHVPLLRSLWVGKHTLRFAIPPVRRRLRRLGFDRPDLLWISDLAQFSLLQFATPRRSVLHVTDDYSSFANSPPSVADLQRWAGSRADAVVTPRRNLAAALVAGLGLESRKVFTLPHGIEKTDLDTGPPPAAFASIPGPRAVYLGALEEWVDWDLMERCAAALPDIAFIVIGGTNSLDRKVATRLRALGERANVHLLGPRPRSQAMACLAASDAALIPFHVDPPIRRLGAAAPPRSFRRTEFSAPMKLLEYLSFGLPVVSTRPYWDDLPTRVETPTFLAPEREGFVPAVRAAVECSLKSRVALRAAGRAFAVENSWDRRVDLVLRRLELR